MIWTGSPGTRWMNEKTRVITPRRTGRVRSRRRRIKLRMGTTSGWAARGCWQGGRRRSHPKILGKLIGKPAGQRTHKISKTLHGLSRQLLEVLSRIHNVDPLVLVSGAPFQNPVNSGEQVTARDFHSGRDDAQFQP